MSRNMTKPTKWVCAQRRIRSAWASAQSDQNFQCPHEENWGPQLPIERTVKTMIRLGGCPGWFESSMSTWRKLGSLTTHWAHSEDYDQTGRMPRVICVSAGRTAILLVLSCRGSYRATRTSAKLIRVLILSTSLFACESWRLAVELERRHQALEMRWATSWENLSSGFSTK